MLWMLRRCVSCLGSSRLEIEGKKLSAAARGFGCGGDKRYGDSLRYVCFDFMACIDCLILSRYRAWFTSNGLSGLSSPREIIFDAKIPTELCRPGFQISLTKFTESIEAISDLALVFSFIICKSCTDLPLRGNRLRLFLWGFFVCFVDT